MRARGWEVNVTRHPIYNHVEGPSTWRFDMAMRPLDGTGFEGEFGRTSSSCLPHGIIGQAYDGDSLGIGGKVDNYTPVNPNIPVITTSAQAEGAIEGSHSDYKLTSAVSTDFKYTRFGRAFDDKCAARDVAKLRGTRVAYASSGKTEQVRTPRLYILSRKQKCSYTITRLGLNAFVYEMIRKLQCIEVSMGQNNTLRHFKLDNGCRMAKHTRTVQHRRKCFCTVTFFVHAGGGVHYRVDGCGRVRAASRSDIRGRAHPREGTERQACLLLDRCLLGRI